MATIADAISDTLREELSPMLDESLFEVDPLMRKIERSSIGVERDAVGRNWQKVQTFITSLAGAIKAEADSAINGDTLTYGGGDGDTAVIYGQSTTWPGITETVAPGFAQRTITLKRWKGNIFLPLDVIRADRMDASIISVVAATMRQTARNVAIQRFNNFLAADSKRAIVTVGSSITDGGTDDASVTCSIGSTDRIARIRNGMLVDIYEPSADYSKRNQVALIVKWVDPINKTVCMEAADGSTTFAEQVATGDIVVLHDGFASGTGYGPTNLRSWLTDSGTVFGINLANYPWFKSSVNSLSSQTPTEELFRKYLGQFADVHTRDQLPETGLTTSGVIADYVGNADSLRTFPVQGAVVNYKGGFQSDEDGGIPILLDGFTYTLKPCSLIPSGNVWFVKLRDGNIKRLVPPALPKAGSAGGFPQDVEFIGPALGGSGIWLPAQDSSANLTPYVQAPFEIIEEYVPDSLPGLVLTGLTEYTVS